MKRRYGLHGKRVMDYFARMRLFEAGATAPSAGIESVGLLCSMDHGDAFGLTAPAAGTFRRRPYRDPKAVQRRAQKGPRFEAAVMPRSRQVKRRNGLHNN